MTKTPSKTLQEALDLRFRDAPQLTDTAPESDLLRVMAARGSCRYFRDQAVPQNLLDLVSAVALAAPTKSDLQQRDIIMLQDREKRKRLAALVAGQAWVADAPLIAVFCGNNRRQRLLHQWHDIPFANDHLDAFFNAAGDAAIALGAFVTAAEAVGLGCCPISAVRNEAPAVSELLGLPDHVFPFAGLAIGYPTYPPRIAKRLPLRVTCHVDQYQEVGLQEAVKSYDTERPFAKQRLTETFGESPSYGWSEDKARHYSQPERADFGDYVRARGFKLD